jgi:tetratricopeptide (TPR) repeat protein
MAHHAEEASDGTAALRHAHRAAVRAAELSSHREAAAQYRRALRFADHRKLALVATLYEGLAYELALLDRFDEATAAYDEALVLWRAVGDRLREGNALHRQSRALRRLCRGPEALRSATAALSTLEPLGSTEELAWAHANLAIQHMLDGRTAAALEHAGRAEAVGEALGATDVASDALNTAAVVAADLGREWADDLRRALGLALTGGHAEQAARAYANSYMLGLPGAPIRRRGAALRGRPRVLR